MDIVKVNIGCGSQAMETWINYDSSIFSILQRFKPLKKFLHKLNLISKQAYETNWPYKIIKRVNLLKGIPLPDESVDFVYSSHFIEHLTYQEGENLLKECNRILKPASWIRIVCPDLQLIATKYLENDLNYPLFNTNKSSDLSFAFIRSLCLTDNRSFLSRLLSPGDVHRSMYDFKSLSNLLQKCGFNKIERKSYRKGLTPDIEILDNRPDESLYVEAQKY